MEKWFDRAKAELKTQGKTIEELAEARGMTAGGMQKWLSGTREPSLDDIIAIADWLGRPRAWLLLGDETESALPDFAAGPLKRMADGVRAGTLDADWFQLLSLAGGLADKARGLRPEISAFHGTLTDSTPSLSQEGTYLAGQFDKLPETQRRVAFSQTEHLLRLLAQQGPAPGDPGDTKAEPSARRK